jgi:hypothetical protein
MFVGKLILRSTVLAAWVAIQSIGPAPAGEGSVPPGPQCRLDTHELQTVEDLSESLANDLLALSVASRDKDRLSIETHFSPQLVTGDVGGAGATRGRQKLTKPATIVVNQPE